METAMKMAAERDENTTRPSSTAEPPMLGIMTDNNYFLISAPLANYFNISPVPRAQDALGDYRWDLLMQEIGAENVVVRNCRDLPRRILTVQNPVEQHRLRRLLRNLQNLLTKFQSGKPELWIEAGCQVMSDGRDGYDYEDDEGFRDADAGGRIGEHREEVAGRPSSSRPSSSFRR
eukprot:s575_g12.t1